MLGPASYLLYVLLASALLSSCGSHRKEPRLDDYGDASEKSTKPDKPTDEIVQEKAPPKSAPAESSDIVLDESTQPIVVPVEPRSSSARVESLALSYCASPWCYYAATGLDRLIASEGSEVTLENQIVKFRSTSFSLFQSIPTTWILDDKTYGIYVATKMKSWLACGRVYYDVQYYQKSVSGTAERSRYQRYDARIQDSGNFVLDVPASDFQGVEASDSIVISLNFSSCPEGLSEFESLSTQVRSR